MGPLRGLKVVELAHIMAGPVCGRMLADMGADVVKVERLPGGDPSRSFLPPDIGGEAAAFLMLNRNKRGIAVNLKTDAGREIVRKLLLRADVAIENYRAGTMERLGIGYESLKRDNPGLIFCEISGFGRTGPYAHLGGFDLIAQGYSGLMSITGEGPGRPPVKCGAPLTDITAGILAAMGVLAAYIHRLETGRGQRVDTSLFEAGITQTYWQSAIALATGVSPGPMGSAHPLNAPYQSFPTSDGWINIGAASQATWERLVEALGVPELAQDPRFCDNAARMEHREELASIIAARIRERSTAEWLDRLERAGVPAGPVLTVKEMLEHPQTAARGMVTDVPHTRLGKVRTLGFPVRLTETPAEIERGAPLLGEHTREVLRELGYEDSEITALEEQGVIHSSPAQ
ncbi:MAG: CoA transferase [Gemmatimonadales bacterium]|nr:Acetyl-CoA:oxalate CoA-transferase [bacterium HR33]GIW52556.1 MAG: CoA transferase [Gemmatimonadales bacterium]